MPNSGRGGGFKVCSRCAVKPEKAKEIVLRHAKQFPVNASWLAKQIGANSRNNVLGWIGGENEPRDPVTWIRMAQALGLYSPAYERIASLAKDLAVEVLEKSEDPQMKSKALAIVRESLAEYSP